MSTNGKSFAPHHTTPTLTYPLACCRIYEHIFNYVDMQGKDFQKVVEENFGHKKLVELITMVHDASVTQANAKAVMQAIIDGDERMPATIAEE